MGWQMPSKTGVSSRCLLLFSAARRPDSSDVRRGPVFSGDSRMLPHPHYRFHAPMTFFEISHYMTPRPPARPARDLAGPAATTSRVIRGGSYLCHEPYCFRYRAAGAQPHLSRDGQLVVHHDAHFTDGTLPSSCGRPITPMAIGQLHAAGLQVMAPHPNGPAEAARFRAAGADLVASDDPRLLVALIERSA